MTLWDGLIIIPLLTVTTTRAPAILIMIKLILMIIIIMLPMINKIITNDRSGLGRVGGSRKHGNPHRHQLGGS